MGKSTINGHFQYLCWIARGYIPSFLIPIFSRLHAEGDRRKAVVIPDAPRCSNGYGGSLLSFQVDLATAEICLAGRTWLLSKRFLSPNNVVLPCSTNAIHVCTSTFGLELLLDRIICYFLTSQKYDFIERRSRKHHIDIWMIYNLRCVYIDTTIYIYRDYRYDIYNYIDM